MKIEDNVLDQEIFESCLSNGKYIDEIKKLEGTWIDVSHITHPIVNSDTDVYYNINGISFIWETVC